MTDEPTDGENLCDLCRFFEAEITDTVEADKSGRRMEVDLCPECYEKTLDYTHGLDVDFDTELRLRERHENRGECP